MSDFLSFLKDEGYWDGITPTLNEPLSVDAVSKMASATTIVGILFGSGVVLCSDSQATLPNHDRLMVPFHKIVPVSRTAALGFAGSAGFALHVGRVLQIAAEAESLIVPRKDLTPEHVSLLGEKVLSGLFSLMMQSGGKIVVQLLLGAYDVETGKGVLYSIDSAHTRINLEHLGYYSIGSGSGHAMSAIEYIGNRAETADDALLHGIQALLAACKHNAGTGKPLFAVRIDADGVTKFSSEEILIAEEVCNG